MKDLTERCGSGNSLIRLSLRKPREWKVALTTSVSSPAIIPPNIQLWDEERGDMLLDTSESSPRCKSASFRRVPSREKEGKSSTPGRNGTDISLLHSYKDKPMSPLSKSQRQEDVRQNRSKSLGRTRAETLIKPGDCVRPPTPVMVARRVSLPKETPHHSLSISGSRLSTPTQLNGITTHHRKQLSDSSSTSGRRKVKHNVSFGRVDTFDESSSIASTYSLNKPRPVDKINTSQSHSSSPKIVISEVLDCEVNASKASAALEINSTRKPRSTSKSKIPVPVKSPRASSHGRQIENIHSSIRNADTGRFSRIDRFLKENGNNQRFNVVHVPEPCKPHSLQRPPPQKNICYRANCERNKHQSKHFHNDNITSRVMPTPDYTIDRSKVQSYPKPSSTDKNYSKDHKQDVVVQKVNCSVRGNSKPRKARVPSRSREQMMSSSSDSEGVLQHARMPPRRRRRSRKPKGDRLVGVNGQCVRSPSQAEDLLRTSADVVHLHLRRHGVYQSLPRHRVEAEAEHCPAMGSNMSRHSGKGLTGRRSQSSGNLCNGKVAAPPVPVVFRFFSPCGRGTGDSVGPRDRYKFCGSLPNHLDAKDHALEDVIEDDHSTYRNNNNVRPAKKSDRDVTLRLHPLVGAGPRHGRADSATMDQGYASERSPEEEAPPELPPVAQLTCPVHHPATSAASAKPPYPFLQNNSTFTVTLLKGTRGLGLSVTGGVDTEEPWPGLIRVKRLFPHQPAWQSGQLQQGDFLLVANNTSLVGLTNYEALEVLRTTPAEVVLTVCRPPPELQVLSAPPSAESAPAPPPPRRDTNTSSLQLPLKRMESYGEFELSLKKVNGSLGFTLRKEDESVLGHYVRALVREPALSDGRIKPGDKIVTVNGVDMSPMSHEEAVMFLRQCGQEVHLKLFRDPAQTPVQALSPTEHHRTFKPILRKEAQDMLSDLAVKKSMSPNESSGSSTLSNAGRNSSPRKRRLTKTPSPDLQNEMSENHLSWSNEVLERITPTFDGDKPRRPDSLNFSAERKPHFQFSASSKTEENLNSLDSLDCCSSLAAMDTELGVGPLPSEPVSMPPLLTSASDSTIGFSYRNPAYRSANPAPSKSKPTLSEELPENRASDNDLSGGMNSEGSVEGSKGLLKWKGVVFTPEEGAEETATSPDDSISQITELDNSSNQVLVVELNRGWNSRLGFSLQQSGRNTLISAIHPDSVASRDGRLKAGDQLIMVNDESIEGMSTTEVINLLRKIRGSICITVWRKSA